MKIAIACRGIVRSPWNNSIEDVDDKTAEWCSENLNILKLGLENHEIETYFCSWKSESSKKLIDAYDFNGYSLLTHPSTDECFKILPAVPEWFRDPEKYGISNIYYKNPSVYKFLCQSHTLMNMINSTGKKFDYIIATRPDLRIRADNLEGWFNEKFNVPGIGYTHFNDHIGISSQNDMLKVFCQPWDILNNIVEKSRGTEDVVKNLVKNANIEYEKKFDISEYFIRGFDVMDHYKKGGFERFKNE